MTDQDVYQSIPVAEARAAVQASGELVALQGPLFLTTGTSPDEGAVEVWAPYFLPSESRPHPLLAKVIVTRKDQAPREVVISWDEYAAELELNDPAWAEKRSQKPMTIFGAEVERHAYRVVFADVLDAVIPRVQVQRYTDAQPKTYYATKAMPRDWYADLAACKTKSEVDALFKEARAAQAVTGGLAAEFGRRLRDVPLSAEPTAKAPVPSPAAVAAVSKPLTATPPKRPQGQRRRGKR